MSKPNTNNLLREFQDVLGDKMILAYGTVLWIIRDGKLHEADWDDEDTFMLAENFNDEVVQQLKDAGFEIYKEYPMPDGKIGEVSFVKDDQRIDIYVAHKRGDYRYWAMYNGQSLFHKIKASYLENPERIVWDGTSWLVPAPVEEYLEATYGDWRTPVSNFDWQYDHKCYDKDFIL